MIVLKIALIIFIVLETLNVLMLYFAPGLNKGNSMGIFKAYEKTKDDPEIHAMVRYLVNWVAGTKLIFIALLIVILVVGDDRIMLPALAALIFSILTYFWRLHPAIKKMDESGQLVQKGYSRTLAITILAFCLLFFIAIHVFVLS